MFQPPALAKVSAVAAPMPLEEPVTSIVFISLYAAFPVFCVILTYIQGTYKSGNIIMGRFKRTFAILLIAFLACGISVFLNYIAMDGMKDRNGQTFSLADAGLSGVHLSSDRYEPDSDTAQITIKTGKKYLTNLNIDIYVESSEAVDMNVQVHVPVDTADDEVNDSAATESKDEVSLSYAGDESAFENGYMHDYELQAGYNSAGLIINKDCDEIRITINTEKVEYFKLNSVSECSEFKVSGRTQVFKVRCILTILLILIIAANILFTPKRTARFAYKYRYLLGVLLITLGVILNINGSSLRVWQSYITTNTDTKVAGIERPIRSDEWAVFTPMIFSQEYGEEPFSATSEILRATDTDTVMVYGLPSSNITLLFRPFLAGFMLLGASRGLAFFWCARTVFLWLISFELFMLLTNKKYGLSVAGAFLILFSPVVQWWFAINGLVEMLIFGSLFILLFHHFLTNEKFRIRLLCLAGMFISGGGYIMTIYPAWMVPLAYVYLALLIWIFIKDRSAMVIKKKDVVLAVFAVLALGATILWIFKGSMDAIKTVSNTVYPGKRSNSGGDYADYIYAYPLSVLFPYLRSSATASTHVCSYASFISFFPLGILTAVYTLITRKRKDILLVCLGAVALVTGLYITIGFPEILAKITLLSHSTPSRSFIAFDLANLLLLIKSLSILGDSSLISVFSSSISKKEFSKNTASSGTIKTLDENNSKQKHIDLIMLLIFAVISVVLTTIMSTAAFTEEYSGAAGIIAIVVFSAVVLCICFYCIKPVITIIALISLSLACGAYVNPVQYGISDMTSNNLGQTITAIVDQDPDAVWAVVNGNAFPIINYPLMFGAKTINCTNTYPDLERWDSIDDGKKDTDVYNRYAHINIIIDPANSQNEHEFYKDFTDTFTAHVNNSELISLGVKYVMSTEDLTAYSDETATYVLVYKDHNQRIYRIDFD